MKELSTNANTEIRWITQTSLSLHFIMSDIFTYIRTVVSAFTQRSTNKFHQHAKIHSTAGRHLCVMFHYKAGGSTCFCPPTFSFSSIWTPALSCCVSRIQSVTAKKKKKKAGLSHKHSAVVDWINGAHLTFPLSAWISTTHYSFPFAFSWSNICRIPLCAGYYCKSTHIRHKLYVLLIVRIVSASTHSYLRKETCCKML